MMNVMPNEPEIKKAIYDLSVFINDCVLYCEDKNCFTCDNPSIIGRQLIKFGGKNG